MASATLNMNDTIPTAVDWINDLTYSDDENDSFWDLLERNDYSSPEGQEPDLSAFPEAPRDQLFHPLARGDSCISDGDEGSYLAYSVSTVPGEEERANGSYGSFGSFDEFKKPGFRHSPSLVEKRHLPIQQASLPRREENDNRKAPKAPVPMPHQYRLLTPTPLPTLEESPLTSATATDVTISPPTASSTPQHADEKERIGQILEEEARKKLRRHKRLKRIKKAAEAREAAVQSVRGTVQPDRWRDAVFAGVFLLQFLLVGMGALVFGPGALRDGTYAVSDREDDNPFAGLQSDDVIISFGLPHEHEEVSEETSTISHINYVNVIQLVAIASGYASLCSMLALGFMMMLSKNILHALLVFAVGASFVWTALGMALSRGWGIPIAGAGVLAISFVYTAVVWDRIPFAATNLGVALKGMRNTLDIPFVGVCVLAVSFLWTIGWICSFVGVFDFLSDTEELSDWMVVVIVFYLFSYYWTIQVIKGISQATVAGIIGQWWNHEGSLPICSSAFRNSIQQNLSRSFGSICLGALLLNPCVMYHRISNFLRLAKPKLGHLTNPVPLKRKCSDGIDSSDTKKNGTGSSKDNIVYWNVNQWSYTYIGLYGYKFWSAGSKASQLFEARGWTHVVSDDLILTALSMTSMVIGGSTACLGLIVEEVDGYSLTTLQKPLFTAFLVGLFVGLVLSSAFLSIIEGSVSAILVCYASAPVDFHANHPLLSDELKSVWKEFWLSRSG